MDEKLFLLNTLFFVFLEGTIKVFIFFLFFCLFFFVQLSIARDKEMAELQRATSQTIEEETKRIKEHTNKIVENAEAVTRETLAACRAESEERVKKVIAECDAKVSGPHVRKKKKKILNITIRPCAFCFPTFLFL